MARPSTPPPPASGVRGGSGNVASPPTPQIARRIEENRLRAKAIRDQRDAELRASGSLAKTASGFVPSEDVYIPNQGGSKRPFSAVSQSEPNAGSNRDGRNKGDEESLRPARKFTKFVDYNMSSMTDTKGGFLAAEDDPNNKAMGHKTPGQEEEQRPKHMTIQEWERLQLIRKLDQQRAKEAAINPHDEKGERKKCRECKNLDIDWTWDEIFHVCVCKDCKEKYPEKYSLLTKTECKEDYLLTDPELRDPELLPHLSRPNPHKSHWHDMMLFLRMQVEEYAVKTKWGSAEALDAEYERRETQKKARKEAKFKEKLLDLKRKTRTEAFRRQAGTLGKSGATKFGDSVGGGKHVHEWGRTIENEEGMTVKTCVECGMEVEELEF
ncbi:hypothetical protein S40285_01765 [Stachybotrys chlorohalonatus IBT 40285]|uniref:DNA repair protein RAD14 n=1 Tax=Stachybotrys chlorohalonatus (strain IBT 40285) TaxID=1283841 RepID=A0A084R286_STAC4|nr:hypothetical protein S40285_01765 [Stachybotrys chlorohalonata IBT 40285]